MVRLSEDHRKQRVLDYLMKHPDATLMDVLRAGLQYDLRIAYKGSFKDARRHAMEILAQAVPDIGYEIGHVNFSGTMLSISLQEEGIEMQYVLEDFREAITSVLSVADLIGFRSYDGQIELYPNSLAAKKCASEFLRAYKARLETPISYPLS